MESLLTDERLYSDTAGEPHFAHLQIGLSTRHFAPPALPLGVSELTPVSAADSCACRPDLLPQR
jgi:hypothetical protein